MAPPLGRVALMADRGLGGFTPQLRRALLAAGVDLSGGASSTWGRGLAPSAAEQASAPWYQLQRETGRTPVGWLTDPGNPAVAAAQGRSKAGIIDPSVQKLLDQLTRSRQIEAERGAEDTRPKPSVLSRALDWIGRPGQAVSGFVYKGGEAFFRPGAALEQGRNPLEMGVAGLQAAGRGLTGRERFSGSQELAKRGVDNRVARAVGGFGLDVATDPLTYVTFGVGKAALAGKASAQATTDAAKVARAAGAQASEATLTRAVSTPAVAAALRHTGRKPIRGPVLNPRQQAGFVAAGVPVINRAALDAAKKAANDAIAAGAAPAAVTAAAQAARQSTIRSLTEVMSANLSAQVRRTVDVKWAGLRLASVPIPQAAAAIAGRAGSAPLAAAAIEAFDRTFTTGSRFDRKLTATKARTAGLAERRIEAARDELVQAFRGTDKAQRVAMMDALAAAPGWGAGVTKLADGRDAAELVKETFEHVGAYIDWDKTGGGLLTVDDLNRFLPKRFKFDKTAVPAAPSAAERMLALVGRNADYLRTADPAQLLYALHIATEKAVARDQLARAVAVFGVPEVGAGRELTKHGYAKIVTKGRDKDVGASYGKHLEGLVFQPEAKRGIERLLAVADDVATRGEVLRLYDTALRGLKKALTLPSPSYHLRNSFGDLFLGYLDDVSGPRGARSYAQASRTMLALRSLGKQPALRDILDGAVDPATGVAADPIEALARVVSSGRRPPGPGNRVMRTPRAWPDAPGGYLSAEQLWAAYNHTGLKRGFVAAELEGDLRAGGGALRAAAAKPVQTLMDVSQAREDYFRLAHFIDRIKRSKESSFDQAAEEAAHFVRKYHFDYHDVTPLEQSLFARIFPFYKFQRFAAPLMVQMFMARPGKILNAQKGLYAASDASGYERDDMGLPTADQVLPEYFRDSSMIPLYQSARGNTVYANPGFPSTAVTASTLGMAGDTPGGVLTGIGRNLVGSVNPMVQAPFELATGRRVFGGGDVPVGPLPQYLAGKTPITNQAFVRSGKDDADTSLASFMTGLGLSENTPSRQRGALLDELKRISANRKKDGFKPPKTPPSRSDSRRDSRGG